MTLAQPRTFRLHEKPNSNGLHCSRDGLFYAGRRLLDRDADGRFSPRGRETLRKALVSHVEGDGEIASRIRSVGVVAKALNEGDIARAMMAAVLMRMPEHDGEVLQKAGFDPQEPRDEHGRWTSGGESDKARLMPVQMTIVEPLLGPMIEEIPFEPLAVPRIDVVPPTAIPRGLTREPASNPFPRRRKCVQEWAAAEKFCRDLMKKGYSGGKGNRGFGATYDQCVKGQVSEECGGNSTAFEMLV